MGLISYEFVVRGLSHTHQLTAADLRPVGPVSRGEVPVLKGLTGRGATIGTRSPSSPSTAGRRPASRRRRGTGTRSRSPAPAKTPRTLWARRKTCWWPGCRSTANCGSRIASASTLKRASTSATSGPTAASSRGAPGRRHLDLRGDHEVAVSPGTAGGDDHRDLPHLQGRHRTRHPGEPLGPQTGQRREAGGSEGSSRPRSSPPTNSSFPANGWTAPARGSSICSAISSITGRWKSGCNACRGPSISAWPRPISTCTAKTPRSH